MQHTIRVLSTILSIATLSDTELHLLDSAVKDAVKCKDIDQVQHYVQAHVADRPIQSLVHRAQQRLRSHREAARREIELKQTTAEASSLLQSLADVEAILKAEVEGDVAASTKKTFENILESKEIFHLDERVKLEEVLSPRVIVVTQSC